LEDYQEQAEDQRRSIDVVLFKMLLLGHYHWNYLYLATLIAVFAQFGMILYDTTTTSSSL